MSTVAQIADSLEHFAPLSLAESWDNVGLLIGDRGAQVTKLMTCLTVTPTTAREAIERQASLIVTHHPVLFRPVQRLTADDPAGRTLLELIRSRIAVYSPHTAFDGTTGGINELLAERLGVSSCSPLRPAQGEARSKLVVFVPPSDLDRVSRAMFDAGAGLIGKYRECSFRVAGRGTFFGSESSRPTIGQAGRREDVEELRLEVMCPRAAVPAILAAMREAHSYEEPAYDIYPLADVAGSIGAGRFGELATAARLDQFAASVKSALGSPLAQAVGPPARLVARVAIACGSGAELLADAVTNRCDALVTGEAGLHRQLEAEAHGIALVLAGHYATERFAVELLARRLSQQFPDLEIWPSDTERDPAWLA